MTYLDTLRQAGRKTTAPPWRVEESGRTVKALKDRTVASYQCLMTGRDVGNSEFIVLARNVWDQLVAVAEAAEKRRQARLDLRVSPIAYSKIVKDEHAALDALHAAVEAQAQP